MKKLMKVIICGGRDYHLTRADLARLERLSWKIMMHEVVTGGCRGVDQEAESWAMHHLLGLKVTTFKADWKTHGKAAGPIRNRQMAEYADAVVAFPGGKGTKNMLAEARRAGLVIYDWS